MRYKNVLQFSYTANAVYSNVFIPQMRYIKIDVSFYTAIAVLPQLQDIPDCWKFKVVRRRRSLDFSSCPTIHPSLPLWVSNHLNSRDISNYIFPVIPELRISSGFFALRRFRLGGKKPVFDYVCLRLLRLFSTFIL